MYRMQDQPAFRAQSAQRSPGRAHGQPNSFPCIRVSVVSPSRVPESGVALRFPHALQGIPLECGDNRRIAAPRGSTRRDYPAGRSKLKSTIADLPVRKVSLTAHPRACTVYRQRTGLARESEGTGAVDDGLWTSVLRGPLV